MNFLQRSGWLLLLSLCFCAPALAEVGQLSDEDLIRLVAEGVPVIDIRRPAEWAETGVIPDSHLLTFFDERGNYNLDEWLKELSGIAGEGEPFILVCRTGNRTGKVGRFLNGKLGYSQVKHLERGITHWISQGLPVEKPTP